MKAKASLLFISILLCGLGLRLILLNVGINLDDAITLYVSSSSTLSKLLERVRDYEFSPPLYFILMKFWLTLSGESGKSAAGLALPSILVGTMVIPATCLLAKELTGCWKKALLSSWLAAIAPLAIFYSHEARCYALLSLLTTLSLWMIERENSESIRNRIFLLLLLILTFYTHYLGIFIVGLYLLFKISSLKFREELSKDKLVTLVAIPALAFLAFLPWLPYMTDHLSYGTYWVDPTPITKYPLVLASNLAATLPLPWLHAFVLVSILVPIYLLYVIFQILKNKAQDKFLALKKILNSRLFPAMATVLIAVSTLGYFTPFILGYTRYLVPFAVLSWILLATGLNFNKGKSAVYLAAIVVAISGLNSLAEIKSLAATDKNALREITKEIREGEFKDSAFLITPDYNSFSFIYYMTEEGKGRMPEAYFTYPRRDERKPSSHRGYVELWKDPKVLNLLLKDIAKLDADKFKHLVVLVDTGVLDSKEMPARSQVDRLLEVLDLTYGKDMKVKTYKRKGRSFDVHSFSLSKHPQENGMR